MTNTPVKREPFVRIIKKENDSLLKAILVRVIAVIFAVILCSILIVAVTGLNPIGVFREMYNGALGGVSTRRMWETFFDTAILLCASLAVTPAFRMKFWNIGAEGQILVGAMVTAAVMMFAGNSVPVYILFPLMILCSILAGVIWGFLPALFKAFWNTNETLFTLMMNYVAIQLVSYLEIRWDTTNGHAIIGTINKDTKAGWIPTNLFSDALGKINFLIPVLIVLVLAVLVFIYMKFSKQGYEIAVVGESENTARYAGINVKKVMIRTMIISGAICGITGLLLVAGDARPTLTADITHGVGFTAIMVSWLSKFNPFMMILVSFFLTFLSNGSAQIATAYGLNTSASEIITGILLFFIIGCEFFLNYKLVFNFTKKNRKEDK